MSKRFGKARVPGCECTYNFTCRHCLNNVPGPAPDPLNDSHRVPREDMDTSWCVYCCHSHPSGQICGAPYIFVPAIGRDTCGCDADHHPESVA